MIKIAGLLCMVVGVLALVYRGFSYSKTKQDAQIGPLKIQHTETQTVPLPPVIGCVLIVAGIARFFLGNSSKI